MANSSTSHDKLDRNPPEVVLDRYWDDLLASNDSSLWMSEDERASVQDELRLLQELYDTQRMVEEDSLAGHSTARPRAIDPLAPGNVLGEYEVLQKIGAGGMGMVYKARHRRLQKTVALKLMDGRYVDAEPAKLRFQREMQAIGQINHPNIVQATDAGEADGHLFLVMEFVDGQDLAQYVRQQGTLSIESACRIIRNAALALEYVHQQGLIHRDVKPSNLMLVGDGTLKLLDLGLAQFAAESANSELTGTGQLIGTLDYMAPEMLDENFCVDHRGDIYALGATFYKLLTGNTPLDESGSKVPAQKLQRLASGSIATLAEAEARFPSSLVDVVDRMLAGDPEQRFQSCGEVAAALTNILTETTAPEVAKVDADEDTNSQQREPTVNLLSAGDDKATSVSHGEAESPATSPLLYAARSRWGVALGCCLMGLFVAATAIYLATNQGTIVIESDHDDVEVRIKKGEHVVETIEVAKGDQQTTVYAGEYAIELHGPQIEQYELNDNQIELRRGDKVLVTIVKRDSSVELANDEPSGTDDSPAPASVQLIDDFQRHQLAAVWLDDVGARVYITRDGVKRDRFRRDRDSVATGYRIVSFVYPVGERGRSEEGRTAFVTGLHQLKGLSSVRLVDVSLPGLSDAEVQVLASLPHLATLKLNDRGGRDDEGANITAAGIEALAESPSLTSLHMAHVPLDDTAIAPLAAAKKLIHLNLQSTDLADEGVKAIGNIGTLQELNLERTNISAAGLSHLLRLKQLRVLNLQETRIAGEALSQLKEFPELHELSLSGTAITDASVQHLAGLSDLEVLSLSARWGARLTDAGLQPIADCRALKSLSVHSSHVDGSFLEQLSEVTELENLNLSGSPITDDALKQLQHFSKLKQVDLRKTSVTLRGLTVLEDRPTLEILHDDLP